VEAVNRFNALASLIGRLFPIRVLCFGKEDVYKLA
jgi:hypothetical protein